MQVHRRHLAFTRLHVSSPQKLGWSRPWLPQSDSTYSKFSSNLELGTPLFTLQWPLDTLKSNEIHIEAILPGVFTTSWSSPPANTPCGHYPIDSAPARKSQRWFCGSTKPALSSRLLAGAGSHDIGRGIMIRHSIHVHKFCLRLLTLEFWLAFTEERMVHVLLGEATYWRGRGILP